MIEVEVKVPVTNPARMRKEAKILGKFAGKTAKIDDYYTLENLKSYPKKSLRIRKSNGYYAVNFKQPINYIKGIHAKKEVEFKVSDINNFLKLIEDFGFKKWLRKEKISEIYKIGKNFQIELNYVKKLGWFVEIERLVYEKDNAGKAREEVNDILRRLGFSRKDAIKAGYTKQLWEKMRNN